MKERIVGLEELVHKLKEIIKEKLPEIYKSIVQSKQKTKKEVWNDRKEIDGPRKDPSIS